MFVSLTFGFIGYWMRKDGYSLGPMTLSLLLRKTMEQKLSAALRTSNNIKLFITRSISSYMLAITQFIIVFSTVKYIKAKRKLH